jgi:hypothetical protein
MASSRQIHFLYKRFNNKKSKIQSYLKDLCSSNSVKFISEKYGFGSTQVQRDRSNFTSRQINNDISNIIDMENK